MDKFGKSQPITRLEDQRFLTGFGKYIDDIAPADALHAFVFRSPIAHGVITNLDVSDARESEGVAAVITAADLIAAGISMDLEGTVVKNRDGTDGAKPPRPLLATDRVRHVGEPVAMIIADTMQQARDAAELIEFDYDELPVQLALAPGDTDIHAEAPGNLAFDWEMGDAEKTQAEFDKAAHVVKLEVGDNRVIVNSIEPRGVLCGI